MKYLKILGLLAIAATALMVFAGAASATTITSPAGTVFTGSFKAESEGKVILHNPIGAIECNSSLEGKIETHGAAATVTGGISSLSFTNCANGWHMTVVANGTFSWHWRLGTIITWTSSSMTVEATVGGISCRYATNSTDMGEVTGSKTTKSTATWELQGSVPFHSGSIFCGTGGTTVTGSYVITSPEYLDVDE